MKKILFLILFALGLAVVPAQAQKFNFASTVVTNTGRPVAGATVTFCNHHSNAPNPCTDTSGVSIWSDVEGAHALSNPTVTDGYGNIFVFLDSGTYDYSISGTGITTQTFKGIMPSTGSGGLSSVGLEMENVIYDTSVTNSPLIANGTLGPPTLKSQTAYTVIANCTGSSAAVTACALNSAMLPNPFSLTAVADNSTIETLATHSATSTVPALLVYDGTIPTVAGSNSGTILSTTRTSGYSILTLEDADSNSSSAVSGLAFVNTLASPGGTATMRMEGSGFLYMQVIGAVGYGQFSFGPAGMIINPAASVGGLQVQSSDDTTGGWAITGLTGTLAQYGGITTVNNGQPAEYAAINSTGLTAAVTTTTLYAVPSGGAGQYRISWNAKVTTADGVSSVLGALTIGWTDPDGVAQTITAPAGITAGTIATTATTDSTTTKLLGMPLLINAKASTNITYAMAYTSNTPGNMHYNLHIALEGM